MVCNWSPEPPRGIDDQITLPSQIVHVEGSDESEDEVFGNTPPGYELLPQAPTLGSSSDEDGAVETEPVNGTAVEDSSSSLSNAPSPSEYLARRPSEVVEMDRLYSATSPRPELTVDCDQVRAAMVGFTLPPSSIPAWAANIPENQLTAMLAQQIQRIQSHHTSSNS